MTDEVINKTQCKGKTAKGVQCSRNACENEIYCKTHIKKYNKTKYTKENRNVPDVIYHTHPPSLKIYPECPKCKLNEKQPFSSSLLESMQALQT